MRSRNASQPISAPASHAIVFARHSSSTFFSDFAKRWGSFAEVPGRRPSSASACKTQLIKDLGAIGIYSAMRGYVPGLEPLRNLP